MTPFSKGISFAVVTALCWAVLAIILKYALHFASPGTIVWFRMLCAATLMNLYFVIRRPQTYKKIISNAPLALIIAAIFLSFNYFGYMNGLAFTSASNAQIVVQIGPLLLALVGVFYFKESMVPAQWLGVVLAVLGFFFFDWDQGRTAMTLHSSSGGLYKYILGTAWIAAGGVAWALFATIQKKIMAQRPDPTGHDTKNETKLNPQEVNLLIFTVCAVALLPLARFSELSPFRPDAFTPWDWVILFILGLNTIIAYGSFAEAIHRIPASYVSLVITMNPLITILLVGLIAEFGLHFISPEPIHWRGYLGAALVVGGVATTVSLRRT